jgi:hypothetical protein
MATKTLSQAAQCAKDIKSILSRRFPNTRFYIKSSNFAGGNSVDIDWSFGPTVKSVEEVTKGRQHGYFNGMDDCYYYTSPQLEVTKDGEVKEVASAKFVQTSRNTHNVNTRPPYDYSTRLDVMNIMGQIAVMFGYVWNEACKEFCPAQGWQGVDETASNRYYRIARECSFISDNVELLKIEHSDHVTGFEPFTIWYKDLNTNKTYSAKRFTV